MILLKANTDAAKDNAVYINSRQDPILDQAAVTLTKYTCAFTNTSAVTAVEINGTTYTLDNSIDVSTAAGALALIAEIETILHNLGYQWDGEHPVWYKIVTTVTTFYTPFSQVVFDQINSTAFSTGDTTSFGLS